MDAAGRAPHRSRVEEACKSIGGRLMRTADVAGTAGNGGSGGGLATVAVGVDPSAVHMGGDTPQGTPDLSAGNFSGGAGSEHAFSFMFLKRKGQFGGSHGGISPPDPTQGSY
jgi:hypothetical protein